MGDVTGGETRVLPWYYNADNGGTGLCKWGRGAYEKNIQRLNYTTHIVFNMFNSSIQLYIDPIYMWALL